ncbi:putative methyltransferase-domain-containing protein [Phlyctochytrium arcticum]|nr:putative methyltransferase-domain-containing protein [Phlyctochytrium arcticum]
MPQLLRLHFTRAPPGQVTIGERLSLTLSISDDLGLPVYFGASPLPLTLSAVNADTYHESEEIGISIEKPLKLALPCNGNGFLPVDMRLLALSKRRKPSKTLARVRLLLQVDPEECSSPPRGEGEGWQKTIPQFLGYSGVYRSDAGSLLPMHMYSDPITLKLDTQPAASKTQNGERHLFMPLIENASPLRMPILEHVHMTYTTGTHLWDCSPILARYLMEFRARWFPPDRPVHVLELGAGCGVVAMTCALLGAHVFATDMEDTVAGTLLSNVSTAQKLIKEQKGRGTIETSALDWGIINEVTAEKLFPTKTNCQHLIVAGDVLYNVGSHEVFLHTLQSLTEHAAAANILIAFKERGSGDRQFFEKARAIFEVELLAKAWDVEIYWLHRT